MVRKSYYHFPNNSGLRKVAFTQQWLSMASSVSGFSWCELRNWAAVSKNSPLNQFSGITCSLYFGFRDLSNQPTRFFLQFQSQMRPRKKVGQKSQLGRVVRLQSTTEAAAAAMPISLLWVFFGRSDIEKDQLGQKTNGKSLLFIIILFAAAMLLPVCLDEEVARDVSRIRGLLLLHRWPLEIIAGQLIRLHFRVACFFCVAFPSDLSRVCVTSNIEKAKKCRPETEAKNGAVFLVSIWKKSKFICKVLFQCRWTRHETIIQ